MKLIKVGAIVNTHGLKGEVKIKPMTHFEEERFAKGSKLYVIDAGKEHILTIASSRKQKDMVLAVFNGYSDINLVEKWKGQLLYVHSDELPILAEDEIYYHDLMGCNVYDLEDSYIGEITEIIETGANAVIRVTNNDDSILIPYVKAFVKEVYVDQKRVIVEMMEGLS